MSDKSTKKTDEMRRIREENFAKRQAAAKAAPKPVDARVNEQPGPDPNGRGGKTKIKVPKKAAAKERAHRDEFPVPVPAGEGTCVGCGKVRATRNGKVITHSYPPLTRRVCPGAGKAPVDE